MSKIYEALQRAEQERAASSAVQTETAPETEAAEPVQAPVVVTSVAQSLPATPPPAFREAPPRASAQPLPARLPGMQSTALPTAAASLGERRQTGNGDGFAGVLEAEPRADDPTSTYPFAGVSQADWQPMLDKLPALQERGSSVEQFRSLRSRLFEFRDLNKLKSMVVSSGLPQEGKSFIAANLAISFARHKSSRVLLIDGDMRRGTLHHLLGTGNDPGLTNYLAGRATLEEILQRGRASRAEGVHPGLASLSFIACGDQGDQAADLSGNPRFEKLIQTLSPHFDWIVIDSSPVNLVTDAVNLARACDGVLLIARGGVTKIETVQRALGEFKSSRMLGVVLNAVEKPPTVGSYYGYDSYDSVKE